MGRTIYVEEHLRTYLTSLAKPDTYVIGLILGQSAGQKAYVVHLAKTSPPFTKSIIDKTSINVLKTEQASVKIKSVKDIPMNWVADHAKCVTRMLPGGMWVLGIFIVGPEDIFDDTSNVENLKSILGAIHKTLSWNNKYLCRNNQDEKLILSFNSITEKYICKSIDIIKDSMLKPADWKFQEKATKWHQLETLVDFDKLYLIFREPIPKPLKKQLQNILTNIADLIDSSLIVIEGEVRSPDDTLEVFSKKKKSSNNECKNKTNDSNNSFQVSLYIPCSEDTKVITRMACSGSIRLIGKLVSRTFIHQKASIAEVNTAVKEDIVRSLASRLEMHWDSLIVEENDFLSEEKVTCSPEKIMVHEPPRRVFIALPENKVTLSDYLFPGEGPQEALLSVQELLDFEIQESQVEKDVELQADPIEIYSNVNTNPLDNDVDTIGNYQMATYLTGLGAAFFILLVAVFVYQLMI
ncbi:PREDICTED: protein odr-4 homolog [Cyphomyrmex costatus]|uniref:protein odr-4 homolog n=1 Tax=Cyphomyrmex costatus TaxID=456900 RepID=UPI0008522FD1|nr:PREDICTED: protein odr-4 homolog [Cyphomyrmex costatus]